MHRGRGVRRPRRAGEQGCRSGEDEAKAVAAGGIALARQKIIAVVFVGLLAGCGGGKQGGVIFACDTGTCPFGACPAKETTCVEYLSVSSALAIPQATLISILGSACTAEGGTAVSSCSRANDPTFVGECETTETGGTLTLTTKERVFYPHSEGVPDNFGRDGCVDTTTVGTTFSGSHWTQLSTTSGTGGAGGLGGAAVCNSLSLIGTVATPMVDGSSPPAAGGEISDGVYVLTAIAYYEFSSLHVIGATETFQISTKSDGTRQRSGIQVSTDVTAISSTFAENFSTTSPYFYNATGVCGVGSYSLRYTATPTTIKFFYPYSGSIGGVASWFVDTFTKQP